jgi:hypothetical protein
MSNDLNCLGQTPAQATEFDAMCQDYDLAVEKLFRLELVQSMLLGYQHGLTFEDMKKIFQEECSDLEGQFTKHLFP